jgi:hypothetical protein
MASPSAATGSGDSRSMPHTAPVTQTQLSGAPAVRRALSRRAQMFAERRYLRLKLGAFK